MPASLSQTGKSSPLDIRPIISLRDALTARCEIDFCNPASKLGGRSCFGFASMKVNTPGRNQLVHRSMKLIQETHRNSVLDYRFGNLTVG
jgi:hypothetical protein